ncbi:MAG TPA: glycosyltransferase family 4 protein, partial [Candidatus Polarisedimenticolaceae bacterium]|nr:glycosyltransferase family 4 protein [Candidatus Polarisedimenticolaceae bacterium]
DDAPFNGLPAGRWLERDGFRACYVAGPAELARVASEVRYDAIYLNSFFSAFAVRALLLRRLGRLRRVPVVLAPRGELSAGALTLKPVKKRAFLAFARWTGLYRGVIWQASSDAERDEIATHTGGGARVVPNVPATARPTDGAALPGKRPGEARFVFLSRIARKKNLHFALELLGRVEGDVRFDVYGPLEDAAYVERCRGLIDGLPAGVEVRLLGPVPPERVRTALSSSQFFLFPTLNENFGHAILEALAAGLPVITSDQTFWRGLEARHAGWDLPLDRADAFARVLAECVAMDAATYAARSAAARRLAAAYLDSSLAVDATRALLADACAPRDAAG